MKEDFACIFDVMFMLFDTVVYFSSSGSVAQLLDSLEEVQILSDGNSGDVDFLHRFLDNNKLQSLLEVCHSLAHPQYSC